jgi:hypothetical protein
VLAYQVVLEALQEVLVASQEEVLAYLVVQEALQVALVAFP